MNDVKYQPDLIRRANRTVADVILDVMMPQFRTVCRTHGYAVAVHGSLSRDIDLVLVPWVDNASEPETVVEEMKAIITSHVGACYYTGATIHDPVPNPTEKPHGRLCWSIITGYGGGIPYFDISVIKPIRQVENEAK